MTAQHILAVNSEPFSRYSNLSCSGSTVYASRSICVEH